MDFFFFCFVRCCSVAVVVVVVGVVGFLVSLHYSTQLVHRTSFEVLSFFLFLFLLLFLFLFLWRWIIVAPQ